MINEKAIKSYLKGKVKDASGIDIKKIGSGVQGSGFLIEIKTKKHIKSYVIKSLLSEGLGHDYPSDRASVFLLDLDEYNKLPKHVKAINVLAEMRDNSIKSIGGGREYYLLMERASGRNYFEDLNKFSTQDRLGKTDIGKIKAMTSYLAGIHSLKKKSKALYWRKIRDTIGHGECLMGVFDTYPEGTMSYKKMAVIEKLCIDWRARLKPKFSRLCQIHGDFHPGNIWFKETANKKEDFILLDRSRGPWGEPADDITALTINYIFFSIRHHNCVKGAYLEGLQLFFDEYLRLTRDREICSVLAPFFAFRSAVVANPVFYPDISKKQRDLIFQFAFNTLKKNRFSPEKVNDLLK